jgi:hypothetical protein
LVPSEEFLADFFIFLGRLQKLEKLEINLGHYPDNLRTTRRFLLLNTGPEKLLKVHTLQMIPYNKFIWNMCPNVTSLSTTGFRTRDFIVPLPTTHTPSTEPNTSRADEHEMPFSSFVSDCVTYCHNKKYELEGDFTRLQYLRINALGDGELLDSKHIWHLRKKHLEQHLHSSGLSKAAPRLKTIDLTSTKAGHIFFSGQAPRSTVVCPQLPKLWIAAFPNLAE